MPSLHCLRVHQALFFWDVISLAAMVNIALVNAMLPAFWCCCQYVTKQNLWVWHVCWQIAANNAPSVFDVNSRLEALPKVEQLKVEPKEEPREEPKPEQPSIVSKWTLVDYDAEEKPFTGCDAASTALSL